MFEASVLPTLERSLLRPPGEREQAPSVDLAKARRAGNLERAGFVGEFHCECDRTSCQNSFPASAEFHRGNPGRFIVVPYHYAGGTVVRVADRFFVVEPNASGGSVR
jgi:hypothetical protein